MNSRDDPTPVNEPADRILPDAGRPERFSPGSRRALTLTRRWLLAALVGISLIALLGYLWKQYETPADTGDGASSVVVSVDVTSVVRESIKEEISSVGTLWPRRQATVSVNRSGQIRQMPLLRNQPVREGEIIARLELADIEAGRDEAAAAVREAEVNLNRVVDSTIPQTNAQDRKALEDAKAKVTNARATYERRQALHEQGGISRKDLEASELDLKTAENALRLVESTMQLNTTAVNPGELALARARLEQARQKLSGLETQLGYSLVRAPFSGVVTEQFQYEGEFASPGTKLVMIADISHLILKAPLADNVVQKLKVGDEASVFPQEDPALALTGHISLISRASDVQNRTVEVWIDIPNEDGRLLANSAARVSTALKEDPNALVIPTTALSLDAAETLQGTVMVVDPQSVAREKKVTIGIRNPSRVQILSGLQEGDRVITQGNYALPDGTKVEVRDGSAAPGTGTAPTKSRGSDAGSTDSRNSPARTS